MSIKKINSFKELASDYDYFLIDIWGVLHDGDQLAFEHAIESLKWLQRQNKISVVLSNSPRNVDDVQQSLADKGIGPSLYNYLHSSGQEVQDLLLRRENDFFSKLGNKAFVLGFSNLHTSAGDEEVEDLESADYILATRVPENDLDYSKPLLNKALDLNIPLVCANPDMLAQTFEGPCLCPGLVYEYYKKQGGRAIAIGKPHAEVYDNVWSLLSENSPKFDKSKTLVIGDGLFTDILGANKEGVASVLITSGIHQELFNFQSFSDLIDDQEFYKISRQKEALPDYLCESFA